MGRGVLDHLVLAASMAAAALIGGSAWAQGSEYYPAFCQGISVEGGDNRMFVSRTFGYPQKTAPEGGTLQEGTSGTEFAREVKRRSGKDLIDSVCYTRPTAEETEAYAASTVSSNGSGWKVETLDWIPKGARRLTAPVSAEAALPAPSASSVEDSAAARAAEAARLAAAAERVREFNERIRLAGEEAKQAYERQVKEFQDQQRAFQEQNRVYEQAKAVQEAQVRAAEAARRQWEADVAACKAGDRTRCGTK